MDKQTSNFIIIISIKYGDIWDGLGSETWAQ